MKWIISCYRCYEIKSIEYSGSWILSFSSSSNLRILAGIYMQYWTQDRIFCYELGGIHSLLGEVCGTRTGARYLSQSYLLNRWTFNFLVDGNPTKKWTGRKSLTFFSGLNSGGRNFFFEGMFGLVSKKVKLHVPNHVVVKQGYIIYVYIVSSSLQRNQ